MKVASHLHNRCGCVEPQKQVSLSQRPLVLRWMTIAGTVEQGQVRFGHRKAQGRQLDGADAGELAIPMATPNEVLLAQKFRVLLLFSQLF